MMRPASNLCFFLAILCSTTSCTQAFVLHTGSGHASHSGLRPGLGRALHETARLSSVTPRGQGSFVGAPLIQSALRVDRRDMRRSRNGRGRSMSMSFDSTILGVGGPELLLILVVGYFVLGPVELFRFTKQAGVIVGQLKDIGLGTATSLGNIMNQQIEQADKIAAGEVPAWDVAPEGQAEPSEYDDGFEDVVMDEFGRVVVNDEVRPAPVVPDDEEPFWSGWVENAKDTANEFGLGYDSVKDPVNKVSKFAEQLSGKVNEKVMQMSAAVEPAAEPLTGMEAGAAAAAEEDPWATGVGAPTAEDFKLANDVPAELSVEEQFERLDVISSLEEERMMTMQRLEARIEAKIGNIKNELLALVDEDFQERRVRVDQEFVAKRRAKTAATAAEAGTPIVTEAESGAVAGAGSDQTEVELNRGSRAGEGGQGAQSEVTAKEAAGVGDRV